MPATQNPSPFQTKKSTILASLTQSSTNPSSYTDNSPKGSIDEPIRRLINLINSHDSWVTTSSCSGRVAVYVEGPKGKKGKGTDLGDGLNGEISRGSEDGEHGEEESGIRENAGKRVVGGKGGGRWLFVSHTPVEFNSETDIVEQLGLASKHQSDAITELDGAKPSNGAHTAYSSGTRLVHVQFCPLILHVLCSSLAAARPLLAAAINAGFRESGVQSLKVLDDSDARAGVMVAIRTAGVGFSTVVGFVNEGYDERKGGDGDGDGKGERVRLLVGKEYLNMCVEVCNERFEANEERRRRLGGEIRRVVYQKGEKADTEEKWEGREERKARKREEGLRRRDEIRGGVNGEDGVNGGGVEEQQDLGMDILDSG